MLIVSAPSPSAVLVILLLLLLSEINILNKLPKQHRMAGVPCHKGEQSAPDVPVCVKLHVTLKRKALTLALEAENKKTLCV